MYIIILLSFREYYVFVSNTAASGSATTASQFRCPIEGFKLRSSNLMHALFIQISRTSSIIDIVVPSKMAAGGHFVKNKKNKKLRIDLKWPELLSKVNFRHLKWPEMQSKVIFEHPKCPPAAIL